MAEESMSEVRARVDKATVTWRALVLGLLTVLGFMSARTLTQIDKTSELAVNTQALVGIINSRVETHSSRLDSIDRRNDLQDSKLDGLWQRFWTLPSPPKGNP